MFALCCFVLAALASPFKSKSRLEAENAALRHQLIVLRRKVHGQVYDIIPDRKIWPLFGLLIFECLIRICGQARV
jgi:hypothetical protein